MTIIFELRELTDAKQKHPERVFFLGDKIKNPKPLIGQWKEITTQSIEELNTLIKITEQRTDVEAWNFGFRTGLNNEVALDFDWEFLGYGWMRKFGDRAKTEAYRTPNLGFRFVFKTTERDNSNPFKNALHTEIHNAGYSAIGGYALDEEGNKKPYVLNSRYETATDNTIIADTKTWLSEQFIRYDFLQYKCVNDCVNKKHIRLAHEQRLALLNFMLSNDFPDIEIHDFFRGCYDAKGRDYREDITNAQITSGKAFKERGGKTHPCTPKIQEGGKVSIPLYQIFGFDPEGCTGCSRKKSTKSEKQETQEKEIAIILENLRAKYHFKTPTDIQELYFFDNGIYKEAKFHLEAELEELLGAKGSSFYIKEIIEHLKRGSYTERENFNKFSDDLIPVLNGLLNLKTLKIQDYDPERIFTFKINATFKEGAKCPKFQKFLDDTLDPEDQLTINEYSGYCLMPTFPYHKKMWFIGGGRNGKGTFILTLEFILGSENCAHINIATLNGERNFSEYGLYGKLINVSSEPTTKKDLETPLVKKLTGGDWIDAEVKGKQHRVKFRNYAKFFILGNKFPKVNDNTVAFWERVLLLKFTGVFLEGHGQIQDIESTWLSDPEEVSGILNLWIEGLHRLLINGKFTVSKTQADTKLEFKRGSDSTDAWIEEKVIFDSTKFIVREDAHYHYKTYCDEIGQIADDDKKFYARLRNTPRIKDCQQRVEGKPKRGFKGISLKPNTEVTEEIEEENSHKSLTDYGSVADETGETAETKSVGKNNLEIYSKIEFKIGVTSASSVTGVPSAPILETEPSAHVESELQTEPNSIHVESGITAESTNPSGTEDESNNKANKKVQISPALVETEKSSPLVQNFSESEVSCYSQLCCYICEKGLYENTWVSDDFTEGKPAHKKCYDDLRAQLKEDSS